MKIQKPDLKKTKKAQEDFEKIKKEVARVVVGQEKTVSGIIRAMISNGHVLVEGIPGIAKTLVIRALAAATGCQFQRIQFTVDLLPTDIVGITTYNEKKGFYTMKGPIFANFVIADEINRSPAKTQSALLEAMQEKQATIGRKTYPMMDPFFVMATQNPIESAGVYQLPEAQIDRFLFKLLMSYPKTHEEQLILKTNISLQKFEDYSIKPLITPNRIVELQKFVKTIYLDKSIEEYIIKLVNATRHSEKLKLGKYIEWGASPRASIGLFIASKAEALLSGSNFVTPQHVKNVAHDIMRHRILLNYEGQAEGITTDQIISEVLSKVNVP